MITINSAIQEYLRLHPYLEAAIEKGLINNSALAREIIPYVESKTHKKVTHGSLNMALKRINRTNLDQKSHLFTPPKLGDLTVRSNLMEITFRNTDQLIDFQEKLINSVRQQSGIFLTITQGVHETTLIISKNIEQNVIDIFPADLKISQFDNLSSITAVLPDNAVHTPGVQYQILKQLAWEGVNVIEQVSTYTEFTIVLEKVQVDHAFSILQQLT